jgi:signal transduction histidine kinase
VLAIVGIAWWLVLRALRPVADAERALRERAPLDLAPLPLADAPRELAPLLAALNALFGRVEHQLSNERGFTALAAHELRAPLAALRMQAQVAARTPDAGRRAELLDALLASVDRCGNLLEQLLTLSRVDDPTATRATGPVALDATFDAVRATLAAEIAGRGVRLTTDFAAPALHADPFGLETLLRNLLHNAIAHAPRGGRVQVASVAQDGAVLLRVDDDGPGIAPADRERVFGRFVRLAAPGFGVGLGLSIVQSVARAHGAVVTLGESPLGGLRVELRFPAPPR